MSYVIRGRVAHTDFGNGNDNFARAGELAYLAQPSIGEFQWDHEHKMARFATEEDGIRAALSCKGPWFNMPAPGTIEAVRTESIVKAPEV